MDGFGLIHAPIGIVALLLGLAVVAQPKDTLLHRKIGLAYLIAMAALNATALWIFDLTGKFGPFHIAAVISLATVFAGYLPLWLRIPVNGWRYMGSSWAGRTWDSS